MTKAIFLSFMSLGVTIFILLSALSTAAKQRDALTSQATAQALQSARQTAQIRQLQTNLDWFHAPDAQTFFQHEALWVDAFIRPRHIAEVHAEQDPKGKMKVAVTYEKGFDAKGREKKP